VASRRSTNALAILGVLLLAGCATPAARDTEASPEPTTSATPAAGSTPSVRVPLDCTDLVDDAELESATGAALPFVDPFVDGTSSLVQTADQQYGALDCAWSTSALDNSDDTIPSVVITVVPDVTSARWAEFAPMMGGTGTEHGTFGAESYVLCSVAGGGDSSTCELNSLIGEYWLSVKIGGPAMAVTVARATPVFTRATDVVTAAGDASARWVSPSGASALSGDLDQSAAQAALGATSLEYAVDGVTTQNGARWLPAVETKMTRGFYVAEMPDGSSVEFELDVLPSGAWAIDAIAALVDDATAVDDLGDEAIGYGSTVVFAMGDDLVLVDVSAGGIAASFNQAIAIAKAVAGAVS
jgi:hypothetical protein